jgi:hypothetical protein
MGSFHQPQPSQPTAPQSGKPACIGEAQCGDIMIEQLGYLLHHATGCPGQCPDCARLEKIRRLLLSPFRVVRFEWGKTHTLG